MMNNDLGNPYFKERDISKPSGKISIKLSDELYNDFNEYIKLAYPESIKDNMKINYSYAFRLLVPDLLNSKCIRRKSFKISVVAIFPKTIPINSSLMCLYLASKDNYLIERLTNEHNNLEEIPFNETLSSEELSVEKIIELHQGNYFTEERIIENILHQEQKYFKSNVEHLIEIKVPEEDHEEYIDFSFIKFDVNNYLDEFINHEFKSTDSKIANSDVHKGLTYFKDEETNLIYYFVYEWSLNSNFDFELLNVNLIDERTFNKLIIDSSNNELHSFLKDLKEGNLKAIEVSEETKVEKLEKALQELKEENKVQKDYIRNLEESYERMKSNKKRLPLSVESEELFNLGYDEAKIDFKRNFDKILHDNNIKLDKPYLELSDNDEDSSDEN